MEGPAAGTVPSSLPPPVPSQVPLLQETSLTECALRVSIAWGHRSVVKEGTMGCRNENPSPGEPGQSLGSLLTWSLQGPSWWVRLRVGLRTMLLSHLYTGKLWLGSLGLAGQDAPHPPGIPKAPNLTSRQEEPIVVTSVPWALVTSGETVIQRGSLLPERRTSDPFS